MLRTTRNKSRFCSGKKEPVTPVHHNTNQINIIQISLWGNTKLTGFPWLAVPLPLAPKHFFPVMPLSCLTPCPTSALHNRRTTLFLLVHHKCTSSSSHYEKKEGKKATKKKNPNPLECICCILVLHRKAPRRELENPSSSKTRFCHLKLQHSSGNPRRLSHRSKWYGQQYPILEFKTVVVQPQWSSDTRNAKFVRSTPFLPPFV